MTKTTDPSKTPAWPVWPAWPFWLPPTPAASDEIIQPINPGWTFGNLISVTEQNSSAPDTERDIVSVDSYGRQLGRVIDALAELINERPKSARRSSLSTNWSHCVIGLKRSNQNRQHVV